jgi:hypothetical protein
MYTKINFRTKKALREAVERGDEVEVSQPGPFPGQTNGQVSVEGPWYPAPHSWYASVTIEDSVIIGKVK